MQLYQPDRINSSGDYRHTRPAHHQTHQNTAAIAPKILIILPSIHPFISHRCAQQTIMYGELGNKLVRRVLQHPNSIPHYC